MEGEKQVVNGCFFRRFVIKILLCAARSRQQARDGQQLPRVQRTAAVGAVQGLRHRLYTGKGWTSAQADHQPGRVGLVQKAQNFFRLRLRTDLNRPRFCLCADGLFRQQLQHPRKFQGA